MILGARKKLKLFLNIRNNAAPPWLNERSFTLVSPLIILLVGLGATLYMPLSLHTRRKQVCMNQRI